MSILGILLIKGLIVGIIVGFVTSSIQSWMDRFFLVILLVSIVKLPVEQAITINLIVVGLSSLMFALRQTDLLINLRKDWAMIILSSAVGGILGRLLGLYTAAPVLLMSLGVYAIAMGLRLVLVRPVPERTDKAHPAWLSPVAFFGGMLTGFLGAGGKPFKVPIYNWALGHHPKRAYALSSLGITTSVWVALGAQIGVGQFLTPAEMVWGTYEFVIITLTALWVAKFWTPKLNKIVGFIISPLLVLAGIRFIWMVLA
jgi:uncharacterized membrane protein YfcA